MSIVLHFLLWIFYFIMYYDIFNFFTDYKRSCLFEGLDQFYLNLEQWSSESKSVCAPIMVGIF